MVFLGLGSLLLIFCPTIQADQGSTKFLSSTSTAARYPDMAGPQVSWHDNLQSGWQEARLRGVPMVIYITSDHCRYCDAMKRDTWCDGSIGRRLVGEFVAIRLSQKANASTLSRIKVPAYPMTLVGVPEGKIISHRVGYQPVAAMHSLLTEAKRLVGR